ncbi:MAG TPA: right-handed parallel beta-helix repeat-containing protein [Candidatus Hydrogenedentes bacterium]|nr:right-handed parallel beta-helix repeat-containing protein [Candidatus Hydrogenedentota bacterium]HRT19594.1 right-handed parallel beta-helix repeat-containing protein [Candidatus Hydrogenedentota bacterium]HRT64150.1 right-handed parallel beta-helix repeat-containing protein [Candidatus Hydrogenedentota bacterium]
MKCLPAIIALSVSLWAAGMATAQESASSAAPSSQTETKPIMLYVATNGDDAWSGTLPEPSSDKSDGPKATLEGARDALRAMRKDPAYAGAPATIQVREGTYSLSQMFSLDFQDSGRFEAPVVYEAYPNEHPVLSGGKTITGWKQEGDCWVASVPEVQTSDWRFNSLWVNGQRRGMARTPNEGFFYTNGRAPATENPATGEKIVRSTTGFRFKKGDVVRWQNIDEALVVVLHAWETSFHHISSIDEEKRIVTFRNAAQWPFENWGPRQRYYVLNTKEGLDAPGEWYLDRQNGLLYYRPMAGEDMATAQVVAPKLRQLVALDGNPATGQYLDNVQFRGLRFEHAAFAIGPEGYGDVQGAVGVPAAIQTRGARFCVFEQCTIAHVDTYGLWLRIGSFGNRVVKNEFMDLGAGGVRVGEQQRSSDQLDVSHNTVDNNFIHSGGHLVRSGVGVWIGQSTFNNVSHNDISDMSNSGITVGWQWGNTEDGVSFHNAIEFNHLHHLGKGEFSNMAGIYILGGSWSSMIRNNVIHDVASYLYGGWGIHNDEGSSSVVIENNLVYNTTSGCFDQYYGNFNRVVNNIFAFGNECQVSLSRVQNVQPILFERNILLMNTGQPFGMNWDGAPIWQDGNCYWDTGGHVMDFGGGTFEEWQMRGRDMYSAVADPLFEDPASGNFRLKPESPALALGFRPFDYTLAGLYGEPEWTSRPGAIQRAPLAISEALEEKAVGEDFESLETDLQPPDMAVYGAEGKASIRVTEETAAGGSKSLKVTDSDGPQEAWQPEFCYIPRLKQGRIVCSFDLRMEPGVSFQFDWRSDQTFRHIGPRVMFNGNGEVSVGDDPKVLTQIPHSEWIHIEVDCALGKEASLPATYTLSIAIPGQETQRFENVPCIYRMFRSIERMWFMSPGTKEGAYYLDNIRFEKQL